MSSEQLSNQEHEGDHFLRLLDLQHVADNEIMTSSGVKQARDFLDICGEHARPLLTGFAAMSPEDPRYDVTKNAIRSLISQYVDNNAS